MKISIDTKEDSAEEIKGVIKMLQTLVGEQAMVTQPQENAFLSMFGDAPVQNVPQQIVETPVQPLPKMEKAPSIQIIDL